MKQISEEAQKGRQVQLEYNKEISQLRKEQRLKDSHIKTLEADKRQKEMILRRKQEEVCMAIFLKYSLFLAHFALWCY